MHLLLVCYQLSSVLIEIMLSYYQSMKIVEFLADQYGFDVIIKLLQGFKERKSFEQNLEGVFGKSINDVNDDFFEHLKNERKKLKDVIVINENLFDEDDKDVSLLEKLFGKNNSPYFEYCMDGYKLLRENEHLNLRRDIYEKRKKDKQLGKIARTVHDIRKFKGEK